MLPVSAHPVAWYLAVAYRRWLPTAVNGTLMGQPDLRAVAPGRANGWREDIVIINAVGARRQRVRIIERHVSAPVTDRQALAWYVAQPRAGVRGE